VPDAEREVSLQSEADWINIGLPDDVITSVMTVSLGSLSPWRPVTERVNLPGGVSGFLDYSK